MTVCMACSDKRIAAFCSDTECENFALTSGTDDRPRPHLPSHEMFKVSRFIFPRDIPYIETGARIALETAQRVISELRKEENPMPECMRCGITVSLPCWFCADCIGESSSGAKVPWIYRQP